jgi:hypothetical protein
MNDSDKVLNRLEDQLITPVVDQYAISWKDDWDEYYIQLENIASEGKNLAWFQSSEKYQYLLRIFYDGGSFNWKPITYNPYFGCSCYLLEWMDEHLIFIYKEKHDTYICVIKDKDVRTFNFHGYELSRAGNIILFNEGSDGSVRRLQLPELIELAPISREQASREGILPKIIIGNELRITQSK